VAAYEDVKDKMHQILKILKIFTDNVIVTAMESICFKQTVILIIVAVTNSHHPQKLPMQIFIAV